VPTKPRRSIVTHPSIVFVDPINAYPTTEAEREVNRWRIDLDSFLEAAQVVNRHGAGEAEIKHRLEAIIRALDDRLERRRLAR
jgi:hypothetical protein